MFYNRERMAAKVVEILTSRYAFHSEVSEIPDYFGHG